MKPGDEDILKRLDDSGLFSQIEELTVGEFREYLEEKAHWKFSTLLALGGLFFDFIKSKDLIFLTTAEENMELKETKFCLKYKLSAEDLWTLKLISEGKTNQAIADQHEMITVEAVGKRVKKLFSKLSVDNRVQLAVKVAMEGII